MKKYIILFLTIIFGCNYSSQKQEPDQKTITTQNMSSEIKSLRLPKSEFEITEVGIGILLLGDAFASIDKKFTNVDTLTMSSEGIDWPAKQIDLGNEEWILVESNDGKIITRLHTNSKKYMTSKRFQVGQALNEVLKSGEKVGVNIDEGFMSIRLYEEGVSINVDSLSEQHFYNSINQSINDIPKDTKIVQIGIF